MTTPRVGPLRADHRGRVEEILRATGVFSEDEVAVALEVFDAGVGLPASGVGLSASDHGGVGTSRRQSSDAAPIESQKPEAGSPTPADYECVGAFDADDVIGYAVFGPTPSCDRTFDLYWIATDPARQGAGVGTLLLTEVERRLAGHFARMLVVETSSRSDYAPTRGFYGRRGYTETARVREFYAPGDDRIIFTKRFSSTNARLVERGAGSP